MKLRDISVIAALGAFALTPAAMAQTPGKTAAAAYKAPRNAWDQPDLQGNWTNATITPAERDTKYGDRLALTDQEVRALETGNAQLVAEGNKPTDPNAKVTDLPTNCGRGFTGVDCGYNSAWVDPGTRIIDLEGVKRSSIIVEPKNGRIPALTPAAQEKMRTRIAARGGRGSFDNPENRSLGERCILSFGSSAGPPMLPLLYNNNYQIVQSKDEVAIDVEMVHDVRHIRLTDKHLPSNIRQWMGDSIGHWEGDTLVVETTNMRPEQGFRGANGANMKVIERFTRVNDKQIKYSFTVSDPQIYTQPYTGEVALNATKGPIYEYACHEGNYALPGILAGARTEEKEALAAAKAAAAGGGGGGSDK
ncbi:MAG TPA: hypothetical protein VFW13_04675 [Phenylobacterium sp.]|nr:hypothetical protein [Phenylobacterium sp.]